MDNIRKFNHNLLSCLPNKGEIPWSESFDLILILKEDFNFEGFLIHSTIEEW